MIKTKRLQIYPATQKQMEEFIAAQSDENLQAALRRTVKWGQKVRVMC